MPDQPNAPNALCPVCKKPAEADYRPFCSKRCADVDLNRWLGGRYVIPGREPVSVEAAEDDGATSEPDTDG